MPEFYVDQEKCTKCGDCIYDCPVDIIAFSPEYPDIVEGKKDKCIRCQHCFTICEPGAISIFGLNPADSIPLNGNLPNGNQMECLIKGRRSIRHYEKEPVDSKTISKLLSIVANAPASMNDQLMFTVVEDQETMRKFRDEVMEGIRTALVTSNLPTGSEFFDTILEAWDNGKDIVFCNAPHILIASTPYNVPCPEADAVIALSYFELLAQSVGLGTTWDNLAEWAVASIIPDMKRKLNIPESHVIGYMMLFGKPAVTYHRTVQRKNININRVVWSD
jgi:nitroreductase/NAD-dependent dihydropyrimidine dehydrogenase PreA subunit